MENVFCLRKILWKNKKKNSSREIFLKKLVQDFVLIQNFRKQKIPITISILQKFCKEQNIFNRHVFCTRILVRPAGKLKLQIIYILFIKKFANTELKYLKITPLYVPSLPCKPLNQYIEWCYQILTEILRMLKLRRQIQWNKREKAKQKIETNRKPEICQNNQNPHDIIQIIKLTMNNHNNIFIWMVRDL